jgi:hypothetical protein
LCTDVAGWISVLPFHGTGRFIVKADVAHQLFLQVGNGSENAARDHIALDLAEPQLDLVEP